MVVPPSTLALVLFLVTVKVGVVARDPMGGLGALTPSHFLLPSTRSLLHFFRRALLMQLPPFPAMHLAVALIRYLLLTARLLVMKREPDGLALGSGSRPGSTCHTSGRGMGASSLRPWAATNAGELEPTSSSVTSTTVLPPATLAIAMGQCMDTKGLASSLMHQFEGAVGKAERLGRANVTQLAGWTVSLGPATAAAMPPLQRLSATLRGLARRRGSTLVFRLWPRLSSCTPSASPPRGQGRTTTAAHRAPPTGWRR